MAAVAVWKDGSGAILQGVRVSRTRVIVIQPGPLFLREYVSCDSRRSMGANVNVSNPSMGRSPLVACAVR